MESSSNDRFCWKWLLKNSRIAFVSGDEQMIPFTGTTQLIQYVLRKPHPVGLKNFVIADPSGIVLEFVIYQGKRSFPIQNYAKSLTIGEAAVLKLCETFTAGTRVYFDRYFTSVNLITMLHDKGTGATGTIMRNRIPKSNNLISDKALQNNGRGSSDSVVRNDEKMNIVKWQDNKSIYMISSEHSIDVADTCKRWSKKEKKYIDVSRPEIIKEYNLKMGVG